MKLVNLTPHRVVLISHDGRSLVLPRCEQPARCDEMFGAPTRIEVSGLTFPLYKDFHYGDVVNLPGPDPSGEVLYIVSGVVARAVPDRKDLVVTKDMICDRYGNVVGARALASAY